jgi:excisionase family DNA binding protein
VGQGRLLAWPLAGGVARVTETPDRLLDANELAELLHVTPRWVRTHTANGDLPHFRLGRYPRYRLERVQAWLDEQEHGGSTPRRLRRAS